MFTGRNRRSGSLRSVWYRRERKRRPREVSTQTNTLQPVSPPRPRPVPIEGHWQCGNPDAMIRCLVRLATDPRIVFHLPIQTVERKLRLFYCACCRIRWDSLSPSCRNAIVTVERYADGWENRRGLHKARRAVQDVGRVVRAIPYSQDQWDARSLIALVERAAEVPTRFRTGVICGGYPVQATTQVVLLRDLFDNPFRPYSVEPRWITPTVVALARVIYSERSFDLMPILADALQDAGCDDEYILTHCRGHEDVSSPVQSSHARGCWLIDAILGKE